MILFPLYSLIFKQHWNKMYAAVEHMVLLFFYLVNSSNLLPKFIHYWTHLTMSVIHATITSCTYLCTLQSSHPHLWWPLLMQAHVFLYIGTQFANPSNNPMMVHLRYLNKLISTSPWTWQVDRKLSQLTVLNLLILLNVHKAECIPSLYEDISSLEVCSHWCVQPYKTMKGWGSW